MNACEIEICVARHFGYRQNLIVPNVSWGLGLRYEADLVVVRPSGYAMEIEIKISKSDLRADLKKRKWRWITSNLGPSVFRYRWFAVPPELVETAIDVVPLACGIISVDDKCVVVKTPKTDKTAVRLTPQKIDKLRELAAMRIWDLKAALLRKADERKTHEHETTI